MLGHILAVGKGSCWSDSIFSFLASQNSVVKEHTPPLLPLCSTFPSCQRGTAGGKKPKNTFFCSCTGFVSHSQAREECSAKWSHLSAVLPGLLSFTSQGSSGVEETERGQALEADILRGSKLRVVTSQCICAVEITVAVKIQVWATPQLCLALIILTLSSGGTGKNCLKQQSIIRKGILPTWENL